MRRNAAALLLVAALSGCMGGPSGPETGGGANVPHWGRSYGPPTVPGVKGPYGEKIAMAAPYDSAPPPNPFIAQQMMARSVPLNAVQLNNPAAGMMPNGAMPAGMPPGASVPPTPIPRGGILTPPGIPFAPGAPGGMSFPGGPGSMPPMMPPSAQQTGGVLPANMPTAGGVINANIAPGMMPPGGVMQMQMAQANPAAGMRFQGQRSQIRFVRPSGMRVSWFTQGPDGKPMFSTSPIEAPGRYNFPQAAVYRLKLSNIEGRPGLEVYPTMEVVPCNPKTEAFLAHSAVPVEFTNEDFKQIAEGNYVVKVIYLPDPQYQDAAGTGTDEILSTRLEPGADPIQEALRRGSILLVIRMGNVDQEAPNTPPLNAPGPNQAPPMMAPPTGMAPPGMAPGIVPPPGVQVPFWGMKPGMPMMGPGGPMPGAMGPGGPFNPNTTQMPPGMPAPGQLNVPSVPMPGTGATPPVPTFGPNSALPRPLPNAVEVSAPKAGVSSTSKFPEVPAMPPPPPQGVPANPPIPQQAAPAFPPTPGTIQGAPLPNIPNVPAGPNFPTTPTGASTNTPMSSAGTPTPTTAQLAGQSGR